MTRKVNVAGREVEVAAAGSGRLRASAAGSAVEVRVLASDGEHHLLEVEGRLEEVFTVREGDGCWAFHRGRVRRVEPVRPAPPPSGAGAVREAGADPAAPAPPGAVAAPTAAVVVAVLVEEGQAVRAGQGVVVVSAMKTETRLASPLAGRVAAVRARVGGAVRAGEVLVQVAAEAGGGDVPPGGAHGG